METWKSFLLQHAKFPYPLAEENHSIYITATSVLEAGRLDLRWKAKYAIRDADLIQKLCNTLDTIVGDKTLPGASCQHLLGNFSPELDDSEWHSNPNEYKVSTHQCSSNPCSSYDRLGTSWSWDSFPLHAGA